MADQDELQQQYKNSVDRLHDGEDRLILATPKLGTSRLRSKAGQLAAIGALTVGIGLITTAAAAAPDIVAHAEVQPEFTKFMSGLNDTLAALQAGDGALASDLIKGAMRQLVTFHEAAARLVDTGDTLVLAEKVEQAIRLMK